MKHTLRPTLVLSLLAFSAFGFDDGIAAQAERLEPKTGKPGTVLKITGRSLDKTHVDEVYLTDHRFDMKVKVLEQSSSQLVIRVPPFVKPGRLQILFLTTGSTPVFLEQPLFLLVEAGDDDLPTPPPAEISQKSKPTVEVASTGTKIPVPMNAAPPQSPATSSSVEKSVVPLKPAPAVQLAQSAPPPPQAQIAPVEQKQQVSSITTPAPAPTPAASVPPNPLTATGPQPSDPGNIPARLVQRTQVHMPPAAVSQRIEGAVELVVVVRADGHVKDVRALKGNPFLVQAALSSVREWVYEPAYLHGKPVESEVSVVLNFKRPQ